MPKKMSAPLVARNSALAQTWLDLESLAQVQVTSQQESYPIELALTNNPQQTVTTGKGWLAAQSGEQTLRLLFNSPQSIHLIHLLFHETQQARTQEFLLRYSKDEGASYQEILRQQYTFSPPSTTTQVELYKLHLEAITTLELTIIPDISRGSACASLAALALA